MKKILLVVVCLLVCFGAFAEDPALRDQRRTLRASAFEEAGIENAPALEELEDALEVPLTDEVLYSSACIGNDVYVLSAQGIHQIGTDGEHTYFACDTPGTRIRQLFVHNGELWGFALCEGEEAGEAMSSCYGKITLQDGEVRIDKCADLDLNLYENRDGYGSRTGLQYDLFAMGGRTYAVDHVDEDAKGTCLISYDCDTGKGSCLARYYGVYDMIPYKDASILALHETKAHLFQDFSASMDSIENPTYKVMTLFDTQTNTYEVVMEFAGNGYLTSSGHALWGGAPAGMAYDPKEDCLYNTYLGELHRVEGLDFATDTVIAEAPGNWLYPTGCWTKSYVTEDGHYMNIVPYAGVDIMDISA